MTNSCDSNKRKENIFEDVFWYFCDALRVMSLDIDKQCAEMDNFNAAWEIHYNVVKNGDSVIKFNCTHLSDDEVLKIRNFLNYLTGVPKDSLNSKSFTNTTAAGCREALGHAAWIDMRLMAKNLLVVLHSARVKNQKSLRNR